MRPLVLLFVGLSLISCQPDGWNFREILNQFLVQRVSGSKDIVRVQQYIKDTFQGLGWSVEEDAFTDETPYGKKPFTNIAATQNDASCKRLVFACHYDSKYFNKFKFLAATDSAVPCAMLIYLAGLLNSKLKAKQNNETSLQFLFFDGEEAFNTWTSTDSLYGSRHLAEKLQATEFPRKKKHQHCRQYGLSNELQRINVLILLDLIGEKSTQFYNSFRQTASLYNRFVAIERRLTEAGHMEKKGKNQLYFQKNELGSGIEDDHIPFMRKHVPIVHLISYPFPKNWHKRGDDGSNLDFATIRDLVKIVHVFISDTLKLRATVPRSASRPRRAVNRRSRRRANNPNGSRSSG